MTFPEKELLRARIVMKSKRLLGIVCCGRCGRKEPVHCRDLENEAAVFGSALRRKVPL